MFQLVAKSGNFTVRLERVSRLRRWGGVNPSLTTLTHSHIPNDRPHSQRVGDLVGEAAAERCDPTIKGKRGWQY